MYIHMFLNICMHIMRTQIVQVYAICHGHFSFYKSNLFSYMVSSYLPFSFKFVEGLRIFFVFGGSWKLVAHPQAFKNIKDGLIFTPKPSKKQKKNVPTHPPKLRKENNLFPPLNPPKKNRNLYPPPNLPKTNNKRKKKTCTQNPPKKKTKKKKICAHPLTFLRLKQFTYIFLP